MIMNPDTSTFAQRKYQVFISSTFSDLAEARRTAVRIVLMRGHLPIALERMNVPAEPIPSVIEDAIKNSQIYLVFLGHRYGSRVPGTTISYTEKEYEIAIEHGLIVVPFVLRPEEIETKREEMLCALMKRLKVKSSEEIANHPSVTAVPALAAECEELKHKDDLLRFHARVKQDETEFPVFYTPFSGSDPDFSAKIMGQLEHAEKAADKRRVRGWIKAPPDLDLARALFALSRNPFLVQVSLRLSEFEKLDARCSDGEKKKQSLARFFARTYFRLLRKAKTHLFFESGSTIAFLAKELGTRLNKKIAVMAGSPEIRISTNNVLAYLQLWLIHGVPCSPFPWGPPEDHYGAAFGCLDHYYEQGDEPDPEFPPIALDEDARKAIADLGTDEFAPKHWKGNVLVLGATSGLQLSQELVTKSGERHPAAGCVGPHVGSFKNKLFKRFMFDTNHPIMLFFTNDKIDLPISFDDCHFVFDDQRSFDDALKNYPLAFCVGCSATEQTALATRLAGLGMSVLKDSQPGEQTAVIARNAVFIERFEKSINFTPPKRILST
jgi:hypothetical protein